MVINIGALKSKDHTLVARDIAAVVRAAHAGGAITKVIIEAALLDDEEKKTVCRLAWKRARNSSKRPPAFPSAARPRTMSP